MYINNLELNQREFLILASRLSSSVKIMLFKDNWTIKYYYEPLNVLENIIYYYRPIYASTCYLL
jgi:hypothetical protein